MRRVGVVFDNSETVNEQVSDFSLSEGSTELPDEETDAPDEEVQTKAKKPKKARSEVKEE